jgi:hypothetical protein
LLLASSAARAAARHLLPDREKKLQNTSKEKMNGNGKRVPPCAYKLRAGVTYMHRPEDKKQAVDDKLNLAVK